MTHAKKLLHTSAPSTKRSRKEKSATCLDEWEKEVWGGGYTSISNTRNKQGYFQDGGVFNKLGQVLLSVVIPLTHVKKQGSLLFLVAVFLR